MYRFQFVTAISFSAERLSNKKRRIRDIMNLEIIAQLIVLGLIVASGPLVIALLAARKGNL